MKLPKIDYDAIKPQKRRIRKSRATAFCAVMCALGVVIMYIGALTDVLDLTAAALASMMNTVVLIEIGGAYPYLVYLVTGTLSFLLLPQKFAALIYILIAGYYPMLKRFCERLPSRFLGYGLKLAAMNLAMTAAVLISKFVLGVPDMNRGYIISLFALGNFTFVVYDLALTMLLRVYFLKYRKMLKIEKFFR